MSRKLDLSALAAKAESGNNSSVRRIETLNMNIDELLLEEPFKSLFPIRDQVRSAIRSHMQEHGYDESKPIDVWKRATQDGFEYVLVDGFTRAQAAKEIGRLTVTAYLHDFANAEEARDYAIHTQRDRRNLSDAEIISVLGVIDKKVTGFKGTLHFRHVAEMESVLPVPPNALPEKSGHPLARLKELARSSPIRKWLLRSREGSFLSTKDTTRFELGRKTHQASMVGNRDPIYKNHLRIRDFL